MTVISREIEIVEGELEMPIETMIDNLIIFGWNNPLISGAITGIFRGILGYIENIAKKKEGFNVRMFLETIVRVIPQSIGLDALVPGSGLGALVTDYFGTKAIKTVKK